MTLRLNIAISYSTEGLTPNDGFEYDAEALAADIHRRLESEVGKAFPDSEIDFYYPKIGFTKVLAYNEKDGMEDEQAEERVKQILDTVYQDTEWELFAKLRIAHCCDVCGVELTGEYCEAHPDASVSSIRAR
jgi:hypothetical protein